MRRVAWVTDPHLNFVEEPGLSRFLGELQAAGADAILVGGDIGEAASVVRYLRRLASGLAAPVYFVLGNHDFYGGSIVRIRRAAGELAREVASLHYLSDGGIVELTPGVGLVGHDGWGDARFGDFDGSPVMLTDYYCIEELAGLSKSRLRKRLNELGDEAARHVRRALRVALERFDHVYLLTHVPPFREACVHEGRPSDDDWAPHFSCKAVGDVLLEAMDRNPLRKLTVLCGHTHGHGSCEMLPNLVVHTGGTEYGEPAIQRVFELEA